MHRFGTLFGPSLVAVLFCTFAATFFPSFSLATKGADIDIRSVRVEAEYPFEAATILT